MYFEIPQHVSSQQRSGQRYELINEMMQIAVTVTASLHIKNTILFPLKCTMNPIFFEVIILMVFRRRRIKHDE